MCLIREVWKDIPEYEGLYQVSNYGRIKSLNYKRSGKEGIMNPHESKEGYLKITLYNGKGKEFAIHRLMCQCFIPNNNPTEKIQVNHINENADFNFIAIVDNEIVSSGLEWVTPKENCNYGTCIERRSKKNSEIQINNIKHSIPILQYTLEGEFVAEYPSIAEIKRQTNLSTNHISDCCKQIVNSSHNYLWFFKNEFSIEMLQQYVSDYTHKQQLISQQRSEKMKGRKQTPEHTKKCAESKYKPILQYTLEGEFVREWECIKHAKNTLHIFHISEVCNGKQKTAGGFIWRYKE